MSNSAPYVIDDVRYDNGTDLVDMDVGYFATHTIGRSSRTGTIYLFYSQTQYETFIEAINATPQKGEFGEASGSEVEYLAQIVVRKNEGSINRIIDIRGFKKESFPFQTASETSYDNTVSSLEADNVKSALDELQADKASISLLNSNITLYSTTASGDFGYNRLVTDIGDTDYDSAAVDIPVPSSGSLSESSSDDGPNTELVGALIADAGLFEGNPGNISIPTIGSIRRQNDGDDDGSKDYYASFYFKIFRRDSGGTEHLVGTSSSTSDVQAFDRPSGGYQYETFSAEAILSTANWAIDDRVVLKYYANTINADSDKFAYLFKFGGSDPVRTGINVPVSVTPAATALGTSYDNASSGLTADNVQAAIDELKVLIDAL